MKKKADDRVTSRERPACCPKGRSEGLSGHLALLPILAARARSAALPVFYSDTLYGSFQHQLSLRLGVALCQIQPLGEYIMFNSQLKLNNHPSLFSKDTLCLLTIGHFCLLRLREQPGQKTHEQMM